MKIILEITFTSIFFIISLYMIIIVVELADRKCSSFADNNQDYRSCMNI